MQLALNVIDRPLRHPCVQRFDQSFVAAQHPEIVQRLEKAWLGSRIVEPSFSMITITGSFRMLWRDGWFMRLF